MAREFARKFYKSKEWLKCRELVFKRDFGLCVICGAPGEEVHHKIWLRPDNMDDQSITLNPKNLITLCKSCHNHEHERFKPTSPTVEGVQFDSQGNLVASIPPTT